VYACPVDIGRTETKGTVLLQDANALLAFSRDEEANLEASIESMLTGGVKVVVTGGTFGDLALHYLNRHGILCFKVPSKFDLQRLCRVLGATASARLGPLSPEELGHCDFVSCMDLGGDRVTVFRQFSQEESLSNAHLGSVSAVLTSKMHAKVASIIVRGSTCHAMDDIERALDDGIQTIKTLVSRDGRLVAGAGQTENILGTYLASMADITPGLSQYAIRKFSEALVAIPTLLTENATNAGTTDAPATATSQTTREGVMSTSNTCVNEKVVDVLATKKSALHLATDAALSVLRVDSIIMSKPAGGPKPPASKKNWDED
jgi:T-complex protein 1 subunit theta